MAYSNKKDIVLDGIGNARIYPAFEEACERIWTFIHQSSNKDIPPISPQELRVQLSICMACGAFMVLCIYQVYANE